MEFSSIYSEGNRKRFLVAAAILIAAIAVVGLADKTIYFHWVSVFVSDSFWSRAFSSKMADHASCLGLRGSPGTL